MAEKLKVGKREKGGVAAVTATAAVEETAASTEVSDVTPAKETKPRGATREKLVKEAYKRVGRKLKGASDPTDAIDDLVKLAKIEKDMGEEHEQGASEVRVRWMESEKDESSKES